jgi:hypothetical protein
VQKRKTKRKAGKGKNRRNRRVSGEKTDLVEAGKATRFQPGTSGNPLGRPATKIFREVAREIAGMVDTKTKKTRVRKLMERAFKEAEKGSLGHFRQIHRLIEEDSISTQTRLALTADGEGERKPLLTLQETLAAIRGIYGLSEPDDQPLLEAACQKSPNAKEMLTATIEPGFSQR